jgi:AcrR family transcriptional regulator
MATTGGGLRPPTQQRSREALERVIRASEVLLAKKGYDGFTVAEVCQRSKVSTGSVYARFESKDALLLEVQRRLIDRLTAGASLDDALGMVIRPLAEGLHRERRLLRAFMARATTDPRIGKPGSAASKASSRQFKAGVLARRDEIAHPDPDRAADTAFRIIYDPLLQFVMYGGAFESDTPREWDELVDDLIHAASAYLRTPAA